MKRTFRAIFLALIVALVLCAGLTAFAEPVVSDDYDTYFIAEDNAVLRVTDEEQVVPETVNGLVCVVDGRVVYETLDTRYDDGNTFLLKRFDIDSGRASGTVIARIVGHAVYASDTNKVYYVKQNMTDAVWTFDLSVSRSSQFHQADDEIFSLRLCTQGLLLETGSGEVLISAKTGRAVRTSIDYTDLALCRFGDFQAELDGSGVLSVRATGEMTAQEVDTDVLAMAGYEDQLYYIRRSGRRATLMVYDAYGESDTLGSLFENNMTHITASEDAVYLVGTSTVLYAYSFDENEFETLRVIGADHIDAPVLAAIPGCVLLYELESGRLGFVERVESGAYRPYVEPTPRVTPRPRVTPSPTPYRETERSFSPLSIGMRGDAVLRLQQKMIDLGYMSSGADGIFGSSTQNALYYLQGDMGYSEDGVASARMQYSLYYGNPPVYTQYVALASGDSGVRVRDLQNRLRDLYYMKSSANGVYNPQTEDAVIRFQSEMGYRENGRITAAQMRRLYASSAPECSTYLDLERGDSAPAVKRLCTRLKRLGYYDGSTTSSYNKKLENAVWLFQTYNGLYADGMASSDLQENMIFSPDAQPYIPEPTPEPDPTPEPEPTPVQVVTNKQVRTVKNWMKNHLGTDFNNRQAVIFLQNYLIDGGYLEEGGATGVYDQETFEAVTNYQILEGIGVSGVADKDTLARMFL